MKEQRNIIGRLIGLNQNFISIANAINTDRTTVSKEIKRNRFIESN